MISTKVTPHFSFFEFNLTVILFRWIPIFKKYYNLFMFSTIKWFFLSYLLFFKRKKKKHNIKNLAGKYWRCSPQKLLRRLPHEIQFIAFREIRRKLFLKWRLRKTRYFRKLKLYLKRSGLYSYYKSFKKLNILKYFFFNNMSINYQKNTNNFSLIKRIFLTKKHIQRGVVKFFYKLRKKKSYLISKKWKKKKNYLISKIIISKLLKQGKYLFKKKKLIYLNINKPLIWKLRNARYAHWGLMTHGKLNKRRYSILLKSTINPKPITLFKQYLIFILLNSYKFILSWTHVNLVIKYKLLTYNGLFFNTVPVLKQGDIVECCFGRKYSKYLRILRSKYYKVLKRIKRQNYNIYVKKKKHQKKKMLKYMRYLPINVKKLGISIASQKSLGCFAIIRVLPTFYHNIWKNYHLTTVTKLNNWRYNFD